MSDASRNVGARAYLPCLWRLVEKKRKKKKSLLIFWIKLHKGRSGYSFYMRLNSEAQPCWKRKCQAKMDSEKEVKINDSDKN